MSRATDTIGLLRTVLRAGLIAPMRPDRYLRMGAAIRAEGTTPVAGLAAAAQRCPNRPGLVDELGALTWRQRLAAFVVLHEQASATPEGLRAHVRDNLANYKVPREVVLLDEAPASGWGPRGAGGYPQPRGGTGKVGRRELQDILRASGDS